MGGRQNVLYLYGILSFFIGILWLVTVKDKPAQAPPMDGHHKGALGMGILLGLLKNPQIAHFVISLTLPAYVAGCFIIPVLSDRIGLRRPVYSIGMLLSGICMFLTCISIPPMIWVWSILWGLTAGAIPLIFAMPMEMEDVGPAKGGVAIGLIMAVGNFGGFIFPMAIAALSSKMAPSTALIWIGLICGILSYEPGVSPIE